MRKEESPGDTDNCKRRSWGKLTSDPPGTVSSDNKCQSRKRNQFSVNGTIPEK
jgi:hypothetical protein